MPVKTWLSCLARLDKRFFRLRSGTALALLLAAMLCGCASTGSNPYPYFETISIEALPPAPTEENDAVPSTGESIVGGAAGVAMGSLMTGLAMSLACGPYFAVCFAGTGAASLGGAAVGAVVGASLALSSEDAEKVTRYLDDLQQRRNLGDEMAAALANRLPASRLSEPHTADAHLSLEVQGLRALAGFKDTIGFWVAVEATLEWNRDQREPHKRTRGFACQTETLPLEEWLNSASTDAQQALTDCIDELASEVIVALQKPAPDADPASNIGFGTYDPATTEW